MRLSVLHNRTWRLHPLNPWFNDEPADVIWSLCWRMHKLSYFQGKINSFAICTDLLQSLYDLDQLFQFEVCKPWRTHQVSCTCSAHFNKYASDVTAVDLEQWGNPQCISPRASGICVFITTGTELHHQRWFGHTFTGWTPVLVSGHSLINPAAISDGVNAWWI